MSGAGHRGGRRRQGLRDGVTDSADYPTTPGAFDTTFNGDSRDAFVTKLNASGSALAYSTFLGGTNADTWLRASRWTEVAEPT